MTPEERPLHKEVSVAVAGISLTFAQVMTVRVALAHFLSYLGEDAEALGTDPTGREIRRGYLDRGGEVMELLTR